MQDLKITVVQADLVWEQPQQNLKNFDRKLSDSVGKQDLVLLPEMFNTGFTMNGNDFAEAVDGASFQWLKKKAKELKCVVAATFLCRDEGKFYNRLIWMRPDGSFESYNKRHLFRFGNENLHFEPGNTRLIVEINGWQVCPMICYDLRFPVWSRNHYDAGKFEYDLLLFLANWPERRKHNWVQLLQARAIDNLSYCAGVNRVGLDGHSNIHSGNSHVYSARGEAVYMANEYEESLSVVTLSMDDLIDYRQKFNVALDWDAFQIL